MEGRISPPLQLQSSIVPVESPRSISHMILSLSADVRFPELWSETSASSPPSHSCLLKFVSLFTPSKQMCPQSGVSVYSLAGKYRCVNKIWQFGERKQKARCRRVRRAVGGRAFLIWFHLAHGYKLRSLSQDSACSAGCQHVFC